MDIIKSFCNVQYHNMSLFNIFIKLKHHLHISCCYDMILCFICCAVLPVELKPNEQPGVLPEVQQFSSVRGPGYFPACTGL